MYVDKVHWGVCAGVLWQDLKGKILLKAKKIGGLEESFDETLTDEVSDDEEMANGNTDGTEDPPAGSLNHDAKVDEQLLVPVCLTHLCKVERRKTEGRDKRRQETGLEQDSRARLEGEKRDSEKKQETLIFKGGG